MQEAFQVQKQPVRRPARERPRKPFCAQEPQPQEGLTRDQYIALLNRARHMRKALAYLAMRMFVCTGVQMQEFLALTVEDVQTGEITAAERVIRLPDSLREELLDHARRNGVRSGPIFVGRTDGRLNAATVRDQIRAVSRAAGLAGGAANVRALQKLYETTRSELMDKTVERLMLEQQEQEQTKHGWKQ